MAMAACVLTSRHSPSGGSRTRRVGGPPREGYALISPVLSSRDQAPPGQKISEGIRCCPSQLEVRPWPRIRRIWRICCRHPHWAALAIAGPEREAKLAHLSEPAATKLRQKLLQQLVYHL